WSVRVVYRNRFGPPKLLLGQTRYGLILKRTTQRRMIVLELIISDAIRRAKTRVPRKGLSRVNRQRPLIFEALACIGWDPQLAHRDAEAFSGGHWDEFVRGFADEWHRGRKPSRGHLLWGAKTYKLTPKQLDLLLSDERWSSDCFAHLAVRTFIRIQRGVDGRA